MQRLYFKIIIIFIILIGISILLFYSLGIAKKSPQSLGNASNTEIIQQNLTNSLNLSPLPTNPRIIALGAPAISILYALGYGDNIIARGSWDNWPPEIINKQDIGNPSNPNLELLLTLKPDVIFLDFHFHDLRYKLERLNFRIIPVHAYYQQYLFETIKNIAKILNASLKAEILIKRLQGYQSLVQNRLAKVQVEQRKQGIFLVGNNTFFSFAKGSGQFFLEQSGLKNMAHDFSHDYPTISREWLLYHQPDFLLFSTAINQNTAHKRKKYLKQIYNTYQTNSSLKSIKAIKNNCIIINQELTYGLNSFIGNIYLAKKLYPHLFEDIDADKIYNDFMLDFFNLKTQGINIYP